MSVVLGLVLDVGHRDLYLDAQALAWQYMPERNRSVQLAHAFTHADQAMTLLSWSELAG